jgi:DNA-binding LacI/PurR family transcriptional regulator
VATVSRAVNDSGPVGAKTRKIIGQVINESGFRPNSIGRQLKTARTHTIGVLVPSLKNPIFADAVDGIEHAADQEGYSVLLASSGYKSEREASAVENFLRSRVDGLILTVADEENSVALNSLAKSRLPFVLMFNPVKDDSYSTISIDNRRAACELVSGLLKLGHQRVAMIAGKSSESDRSIERQSGYRDALRSRRIRDVSITEVDFENPDIEACLRRQHQGSNSPTAYFCSTDLIAILTLRALTKIGVKVPDEVSVIGFDGISVGEWLVPSLTTVVQPAERMGQWAMQHLVDRIDHGAEIANLVLPYELRQGESMSVPCNNAGTIV